MNAPLTHAQPVLDKRDNYWVGRFTAMASPCEVIVETDDKTEAYYLTQLAAQEAWRIEQKYSRYRQDNIVCILNQCSPKPIEVDAETARLLNFADECYRLSNGMFDITSGILRKIWKFDGSDRIPSKSKIKQLLKFIGWDKVNWKPPFYKMATGMEIDLGGFGKEYAVDQAMNLINQQTSSSVLVNFGGDLHANKPRKHNIPWLTGIENPANPVAAINSVELLRGAIATSGDARRYLLKDGIRYSHILNPKTGWPITDAPHSVTVTAATCTEAGFLSTLASLQGKNAEAFLDQQGVRHWCIR